MRQLQKIKMKTMLKKLAVSLLICAALSAPLRAETNVPAETASNATHEALVEEPPKPPVIPPVPHVETTNTGKKHPAVRHETPNFPPGMNAEHLVLQGVLVAVVAIMAVFGAPVAIFGLFFYFRHRRNKMLHETLRAMVEKGVEIPPELLAPPEESARRRELRDFRTGIIMVAVGLALLLTRSSVGFIPLLIGVSLLIFWKVEQKRCQTEK